MMEKLYPITYPGRPLWRAAAFGRDFLVTPLPVDPESLNPGYSIYVIEETPYARSWNPVLRQYDQSRMKEYSSNPRIRLYLVTNKDFSPDEMSLSEYSGCHDFVNRNPETYLSDMDELTKYRHDADSSVFDILAKFYKDCPPIPRRTPPKTYRISQAPYHGAVVGYVKFMAPDPVFKNHKVYVNALFTNATGDNAFADYEIPSEYHRYNLLYGKWDENVGYSCLPGAIANPDIVIPADLTYGTIVTDRKIAIPYGVMPIERLSVLPREFGSISRKFSHVWISNYARKYGVPSDYVSLGYDDEDLLDWSDIADETVARYLEESPPNP